MSVSFYPYVAAHDGFDWPDGARKHIGARLYDRADPEDEGRPNPDYDPRLDLSLSNRNAALVINELGFLLHGEASLWDAAPIPIAVFSAGVAATLKRIGNVPEPGIPGHVEQGQGRATFIFAGVPDGYVNQRIGELVEFVEASRALGATHIGWG